MSLVYRRRQIDMPLCHTHLIVGCAFRWVGAGEDEFLVSDVPDLRWYLHIYIYLARSFRPVPVPLSPFFGDLILPR